MISAIAGAAILIFGSLYYFFDYRTERELQAFNEAYQKFTATVGATPSPLGSNQVTYPDEQTKFTEAAAAFEKLASEHSGQRDVANYFAGLSYLHVDADKGVALLTPLADSKSPVSHEAQLALAQHFDAAGKFAEAEAYYAKLSDDPGGIPRLFVLNAYAGVQEKLGKREDAARNYKLVLDVDRNSQFGIDAEKGLQRVDPAAALNLPERTRSPLEGPRVVNSPAQK